MSKHHLIFAKEKTDEKQKRKYKTRQLLCFLHKILKKKKKFYMFGIHKCCLYLIFLVL